MPDAPAKATASGRSNRASSPSNRATAPEAADKKSDAKDAKKGSWLTPKTAIIVAVLAVVIVAISVFGKNFKLQEHMETAVKYVEAQGNKAMYYYLAITLIGVVCLVPTTPLELAGGFLFSPSYGMWTTLAYTGGTKLIANVISVLLARFIFKDWVKKNIFSKFELLKMVDEAVKEQPWTMAFLVRGSMLPLAAKNYGLGVMEIGYLPIAVNSSIFTNFYAFQNIYMGSTMQNIAEVFGPKKAAKALSETCGDRLQCYAMAYFKKFGPIVFNVALVVFLVYKLKSMLKKQTAKMKAELENKEKKGETKKDS